MNAPRIENGPVARLSDVRFTYRDSDRPALAGVDLEVAGGEMVVVMGPTGAGKTTLAKCLARIVPAFHPGSMQGEVSIGGRVLDGEGVADVAGLVGFVSQDFESQLFATGVVQEIAFAMEQFGVPAVEMERRIAAALDAVGLAGFERRDPATLSGGEKQRLAIASVLALQPALFVLDEPTTDLDPEGKLQVFDVLARLRAGGAAVVLVEHEIAAAERADHLVLMDEGRIVADDCPDRLLPQVDRLEPLGVRAADLDRLAARLGYESRFSSVDAGAEFLRPQIRAAEARPAARRTTDVVLTVEEACYDYDGHPRALDRVSLRLWSGEFVAVIGQNGCGKTTLARHLNGLLQPSRGRVLLDGRDLCSLLLVEVAREVGYVFQNPDHQIFASSVREEVAFGPVNAGVRGVELDRRVGQALESVGLAGLDDEDPFLLGKGYRQQLAVASVLVLRPRVLILDEPTTGLDYPEQRRMMDLLRRLHEDGLTVVVITHSPWVVAEYAERGILMRGGRVEFDGALRELFAREELLEECRFTLPDITRVGRRCGFTPLRLEELLERVGS